MSKIGGVSAIIGTILAILTFYFSTYLPYINGDNTPATETFTPVLQAIPNAKAQHEINANTNRDTTPPDEGTTTTNRDTVPPDIFVPDDITVEATSSDGAIVPFEVSAEDNVDRVVDVLCDYNSGDTFQIGTTRITCSAEDSAGNRAEEGFTITVQDTSTTDTVPPDIFVPDDITVEATSSDGAIVPFEVSAEDNVDGAVDVSCDYNSGDTFPIGDTVVTCSAEDSAGNRAEEGFTITVQGTTPPDEGTTPPDEGTTPPDEGTTPPDEGTTPPDEGTTPPSPDAAADN